MLIFANKPFDSIQSLAYTVPGNLKIISFEGHLMATITKIELINRIAEKTQSKPVTVKTVVPQFLGEIVSELAKGNRIEFRDFGVFEVRETPPRTATYSGQMVQWDEAMKCETDLGPEQYRWGADAPIKPDSGGLYACAMSGQTKPY